jgi:hypothetical protein
VGDLAGEPIDLTHRHPGTPPQGPGQLPHPPPGRTTTITIGSAAGRATRLNMAHQPTEFADRLLEQIRVGREVDVGLHHGGVDPSFRPRSSLSSRSLPSCAV